MGEAHRSDHYTWFRLFERSSLFVTAEHEKWERKGTLRQGPFAISHGRNLVRGMTSQLLL